MLREMMSESSSKYEWFGTTQWTQVINARDRNDGETGRKALENLCGNYWAPLYGYVRRKGYQPADAKDLTQGFFVHLLNDNSLARVDREHGRFRSFLLVCINNHLHNEWRKNSAKKRGGEFKLLSVDWENAESNFQLDAFDHKSPEYYYEKKWALEVLGRALARLRKSYEESGKGELFNTLKPYLTAEAERGQVAVIAEQLGMKTSAVRMAVSRLRKRYRDMLRFEVNDTVADPKTAEQEFLHICTILSGR